MPQRTNQEVGQFARRTLDKLRRQFRELPAELRQHPGRDAFASLLHDRIQVLEWIVDCDQAMFEL